MPSLAKLQEHLGVYFADPRLLQSVLIHRSFLHERPDQASGLIDNERLEFLGDAILNYLAATTLFVRYPERGEGDLTALRSALVKTTTLAEFARDLGLGAYLRLSKGEEQSGARERDALLADTFEALVAAIYLDQGLDAASAFAGRCFDQQLARIDLHGLTLDYKSQLQQRIQAERNLTPRYQVIAETGHDPRREYTIEVLAGAERLGVGVGSSKQAATQAAARSALDQLVQ
ncbi:MAG: ribonuclease III [Kouleothrix sp.]|jgi:ribonuclease-3